MQIWPRDFWWNPHLFCSLSTSTFGTACRAPAHATLERTAAFKGECLHLGYQMLGTGFTWVTQWAMQRGELGWPPRRITSGFILKPALIHKQDLPLLPCEGNINTKWTFSSLGIWCLAVLPVFGTRGSSHSSWLTSESFCSWGMCSEILPFGDSEVWSACAWSLTQMSACRYWLYWLHIS